MTKNKTAICTPTATREEFESILRELDGVGVKWVCGGEKPLEWTKFFSPFLCYEDFELSNSNSAVESMILPRAEFIAAIKRDFGKCEHHWTMGPGGEICVLCGQFKCDTGGSVGTWTSTEPDISKTETTAKCEHVFDNGVCVKCGVSIKDGLESFKVCEIEEQPKMKSIYERIAKAEELVKIQGSDGNWNYDPYMHGMYNGMELVLATVEGRRSPTFRDAPAKWLSDKSPKIDCSYPTEIKEQPKMNYNKMTKAELIDKLKAERGDVSFLEVEIKKRDREISELKAKWTKQDEVINNREAALEFVRGTADEQGKKILILEKTNAEQAETIAELKGASKSDSVVIGNLKDSLVEANREFRQCAKETARIKRILAQANADVLEGK